MTHIGLIGGIGPAATEVYYRALVRAHATAGRRMALTIAHADTREMIANMEAGKAHDQARIFAGYVDQLRAGGCEAVAVTSMGGHFCVRELEAISSLPVISAIPVLDAYFADQGTARVGVLGTRAVMQSKLYGLSSAEVIIPSPEDLPDVHATYLAIAVSAAATSAQSAFFHAAGRKLIDAGAEIVVLGGTDLSVAFANTDPDYPTVDSALIHAAAIAQVSMNPHA